jgi:hypothetical protein
MPGERRREIDSRQVEGDCLLDDLPTTFRRPFETHISFH